MHFWTWQPRQNHSFHGVTTRKWLFLIFCGLFALSSLGCTVTSQYMTTLPASQSIVVDPAAATVVFLRPSGYAGSVKHIIMDQNGRFLGENWGWTYFAVKMPPGQYTFVAWSEGTPALQAVVEAGKVYYVEVSIVMGGWSPRSRLFALGPRAEHWNELPAWLARSEMLVPNEASGQAELAERGAETNVVVAKGLRNWANYDAEARDKRSLTPADGLSVPVR